MKTVQKIWNLFLDVIFPPICVGCLRRGERALCGKCAARIEINNSFFCPECARRLPEAKNFCHPQAKFVLAAAASYEDKAVREMIHSLKYNRTKAVLKPLGEIAKTYLQKVIGHLSLVIGNSIIVPLPLHPQKERERGFNQAALIAGIMNNELGVRIEENNLIKIRKTNSQIKTKNYEEREENVRNCFKVKNPEIVAGKNIILVDDVFTSGATMKEAVRILKSAGAKKIIGFVIAKA